MRDKSLRLALWCYVRIRPDKLAITFEFRPVTLIPSSAFC